MGKSKRFLNFLLKRRKKECKQCCNLQSYLIISKSRHSKKQLQSTVKAIKLSASTWSNLEKRSSWKQGSMLIWSSSLKVIFSVSKMMDQNVYSHVNVRKVLSCMSYLSDLLKIIYIQHFCPFSKISSDFKRRNYSAPLKSKEKVDSSGVFIEKFIHLHLETCNIKCNSKKKLHLNYWIWCSILILVIDTDLFHQLINLAFLIIMFRTVKLHFLTDHQRNLWISILFLRKNSEDHRYLNPLLNLLIIL